MRLRKGMRVRQLTRREARFGRVVSVSHGTVEVQWDDGHRTSGSGAYLVAADRQPRPG